MEPFTLQGTNISPKNGILKMIFLFPRWDMLISWRVTFNAPFFFQTMDFPTFSSYQSKKDIDIAIQKRLF